MPLEEYGVAMDDDALTEFLETQGLGTLALGSERGGYAFPVSYGYDRSRDRCIFQFAFGADSTKASFIEADNPVSLSVYEWEPITEWRSAVVRGTLHQIPDSQTATAAGIFAAHAKIASLDVFQQPLEELDLEWYELRIDDKQGRQSAP